MKEIQEGTKVITDDNFWNTRVMKGIVGIVVRQITKEEDSSLKISLNQIGRGPGYLVHYPGSGIKAGMINCPDDHAVLSAYDLVVLET